MLVNFVV